MERLDKIASHQGIVIAVKHGIVAVQIESTSACAGCAAHSRCGFAESKNKTLDIPTPDWHSYSVGQPVTVRIDQSRGLLAVWVAYLLPALLILAVVIALSLAALPEWAVILASFAVLALYILLLYFRRKKINSTFTLSLSH